LKIHKKIPKKIREEKDPLIKGLKIHTRKLQKKLKYATALLENTIQAKKKVELTRDRAILDKEALKRQLIANNIVPDYTFDNWT
jgi:hypothetical protein